MEIIGIAATTANGYIAKHSTEKVEWSRDLSLFKKQTKNSVLFVGYNTHTTILGGLEGRRMIVVKKSDTPSLLLGQIKGQRCFVIGGGKTFSMFAPHLTHLYITIHPLVFRDGIRLFSNIKKDISLSFIKKIPVVEQDGIYQFQYRVIKKT